MFLLPPTTTTTTTALLLTLLTFSSSPTYAHPHPQAQAPAPVPATYRKVYITSAVNSQFVVVPKTTSPANGGLVVVQTSTKAATQQWHLTANATKIYLASNTALCLDAGAKTAWKDMAPVYTNTCSDSAPGQKWIALADGRIAVDGSSPQECLDLQYMQAKQNNPVGLYACAGLGNQGAKDKGINWPLVDAA